MKFFKSLLAVPALILFSQAAFSSGTQSTIFFFKYEPSVRMKIMTANDGQKNAGVRFDFATSFKSGNLNCTQNDCFYFIQRQEGSDLLVQMSFVNKKTQARTSKLIKVATIRGDGRLDFVVPHKVTLTGAKKPRLFCKEISLPTLPSTERCSGSDGIYTILLK